MKTARELAQWLTEDHMSPSHARDMFTEAITAAIKARDAEHGDALFAARSSRRAADAECAATMADMGRLRAALTVAREACAPLAAIGEALKTQDNRLTHLPVFMVQRHRRTYGFDPQYTEDCVAWLDSDYTEVTDEEFERLEAKWDESGDEPDGYTRTAYQDTWENVMPFFTEKAAQRYIDENKHNLSSPRIYVESGYRNHEWDAIRRACIALAALTEVT